MNILIPANANINGEVRDQDTFILGDDDDDDDDDDEENEEENLKISLTHGKKKNHRLTKLLFQRLMQFLNRRLQNLTTQDLTDTTSTGAIRYKAYPCASA
jgi:hypothetical protein